MVDDESLPKSGVLTSPNYPERYPNSHDSTQTVQVAEGKTIHFNIMNFNTEPEYDYVEIIDEDGTNVMPPGSGGLRDLQLAEQQCSSNSNIAHVKFHTDGDTQRSGWRIEWSEQ